MFSTNLKSSKTKNSYTNFGWNPWVSFVKIIKLSKQKKLNLYTRKFEKRQNKNLLELSDNATLQVSSTVA